MTRSLNTSSSSLSSLADMIEIEGEGVTPLSEPLSSEEQATRIIRTAEEETEELSTEELLDGPNYSRFDRTFNEETVSKN